MLGLPVLVSDTDRFVAVSGVKKKDYINKEIDEDLDYIIQGKSKYRNGSRVVVPILTNGDPIGAVTILPPEGSEVGEIEVKAAELGAGFLAGQMQS